MIGRVDTSKIAYINKLPPRWGLVLMMRNGLYNGHFHTQREIAKKMGISATRVQQIESTANSRLIHIRTKDMIRRRKGIVAER